MQGSILFLGTGGDSIVVGKQYRASGGIILNVEDMQFHIDPGPGSLVMAKMYGVNLRENTAVLLSHNHINHANDVNAVISAMTHNGLDHKGVLVAAKSAISGSSDGGPFLRDFYRSCVEKAISVDETSRIAIGEIDIKATPTKHSDADTVGFKIFTKRFTMSYTSDTVYTKEVAEAHRNSDILIINVKHPGSTPSKNNMNSEGAAKLIEHVNPKLAIITHFGIKMVQADPLYEARELQKVTKVNTIAAKDGMVINPYSFSSSVIQRTLKGY